MLWETNISIDNILSFLQEIKYYQKNFNFILQT